MKRIYVISGGTMVHVRPHFALCAPAYGTVGDHIAETLAFTANARGYEVIPLFTRMARENYDDWPHHVVTDADKVLQDAGVRHLETNQDLETLIDHLVAQPTTRCIVLAAAVCDWVPHIIQSPYIEHTGHVIGHTAGLSGPITRSNLTGGPTSFGKDQPRLKTRGQDGNPARVDLTLLPADKILNRIRAGAKGRKDVFLVSFKATTGLTKEETYAAGLKALKGSSSNLVFANDVQNKHNVIVTPEEFPYYQDSRDDAVATLCGMIEARLELDFVRTTVLEGERADIQELHNAGNIPANFLPVLQHLIKAGAYKVLPWKESTSGHFGCTVENRNYKRISSVRKANHNKVLEEGVAKIVEDAGDSIIAMGARPSVGEHTQRMIYTELAKLQMHGLRDPNAHSIVHFHCPLKPKEERQYVITSTPQKPFECGSVQCGVNTSTNMGLTDVGIWAVHLEGHGPNIAFHRDVSAERVIAFIDRHWDLSAKSGGTVVPVPEAQ